MQNIDNVILLGFKNTEEIITLMDNSFAFLLTSFSEGTPTSILEACSRGLPIVTSNVGGIKSIIKEEQRGLKQIQDDIDAHRKNQFIHLAENAADDKNKEVQNPEKIDQLCSKCGQYFTSLYDLAHHFFEAHRELVQDFDCPMCPKIVTTKVPFIYYVSTGKWEGGGSENANFCLFLVLKTCLHRGEGFQKS